MIDSQRLDAILREAGRIAFDQWPGAGNRVVAWDKSPGNPVSAADLAADAFLKRELAALLPAAGWLSEETVDAPDRLARDLVWLVDPIDGTRDFLRGRTGWAISVALIRDGRPLIAALFAPVRGGADGEMWHARAGHGATRDGAPIAVSGRIEFPGARVPADSLPKIDRMLEPVAKPNSIALRIAMVAAGEADLVTTARWGFEWDIAAAALIAREAGAAVTDAFGEPFIFNKRDPRSFGLVAATPAIHPAAIAHMADRAAERRRKAD